MPNPLFDQLFGRHAGSNAVFLELSDGYTITYSTFLANVARVANLTVLLGLKPGDRVAAQVEKSPEALAVYGACVQAGLVFLPLNTGYTAQELTYFIQNSGASLLLCDARNEDALAPIAAAMGAEIRTLNADGSGSLIDQAVELSSRFETVDRAPDDLASLLYTSGTTGRSKGAMLTQSNLLSNARTLTEHWQFTDQDTLLHALPIFHTHGLFVGTNVTLQAGGKMLFMPKFDLDQVFNSLPRCTTMMGVPTFYTRLLSDDRLTQDATKHMRLFVSGSAPLLAETHVSFQARTGHTILERYGMTETNMNTSNPYDGDRVAGTVGLPLPGTEVIVTDPSTGGKLAPGEVGQIEVRGANVFKGYWQMPEKTAEELRDNGFFITGDLGKFDERGYLHIVGRNKDLIISGGYNIYPKEIELLLDAAPGVLESAVVGVAHADFGEGVVAVLVSDGDADIDVAAIKASMVDQLARFKQPKAYEVVNELPRNTMGKVQKNLLRETYKDAFTQ